MSAISNILKRAKTPESKRILGKLGWMTGTAVATGGLSKGLDLAQEELSGRNSVKRAMLRKVDELSKKDPMEIIAKAGDLYRSFNKGKN